MAITAKTYSNILKYGVQADYDALASKDANVLYFCTDTKKIYKGTVDFTDSVVYASSKPEKPIVGKLYILSGTGTAEVYNGTSWTVVSYPMITAISDTATDVDDVHVASAKAVKDYVDTTVAEATSSDNLVKGVANKADTEATLVITKANGTTSDLTLAGVVTTPSYDATTRKFTFPVSDGDDVVVELGKDIFIDPNGDNSYHADTKEIWLTLNDGSGENPGTVIKIPATGLVNIISTEDTTSVDMTYTDGKIKAEVILKKDSTESGAEFTNSLKLAADGLYVDLSGYYTKTEADAITDALDTRLSDVEDTLDTLTADDKTVGSIDYKIAQVNTDLTAKVNAAQAKADQNEADLAALAAAVSVWGTF